MSYFLHQSIFVIRLRYLARFRSWLRKLWLSAAGMHIGKRTIVPKIYVNWPNQVVIGDDCILEHHIFFRYSDIWKHEPTIRIGNHVFIGEGCEFNISFGIDVGNDSLIASGCKFIDHDHDMRKSDLMRNQPGPGLPIQIGSNVWLGCNVVVLKGVQIGDGAVIAAGAVVTRSVLANEIWGGVPAKKLGQRI